MTNFKIQGVLLLRIPSEAHANRSPKQVAKFLRYLL